MNRVYYDITEIGVLGADRHLPTCHSKSARGLHALAYELSSCMSAGACPCVDACKPARVSDVCTSDCKHIPTACGCPPQLFPVKALDFGERKTSHLDFNLNLLP